VAALAAQGVRELTLLGQNVNAYRGVMTDGSDADLALLLHFICAIRGIDRVRYTTSHPLEMSSSLISAYRELPKLVGHLHLPVQSGSNRILLQMKRGYDVEKYLCTVESIKIARPGIAISSDFIVGFPGETDDDFKATLDLVDRVGFDNSYSFIYSARPGTPAATFPDDVPMTIKKQRLSVLQERLAQSAAVISRSMIGTIQRILVQREARRGANLLTGRTENNRSVYFPGDSSLIGQFIEVNIIGVQPNSLQGEAVSLKPPLAKLG
jgi:tRNA-2-methylthio-N6-dimethylallyladenosine synthase